MNPIAKIETLLQDLSLQPSQKKSSYDQELASLENFIDKLVTAENKATKANSQAAIQKEQMLAQFKRKLDFLSGQVQQAEIALAALEGTGNPSSLSPSDLLLLNARKSEVSYWKSQIRQLIASNETSMQ
jgi:hypothetical protein